MNKYEARARDERKSVMRSSMSIGTAGVALLVVGFMIVGFRDGAPPEYFYRFGAVGAAVLLILRQVGRRLKTKVPKSAQPDPKSTLKLS